MNQITDPPIKSDFGYMFNYEVWSANTHITLTNVPWNNDYRDVVSFKSSDAINKYIDTHSSENVTMTNSTYAKANEPILIDVPFNRVNQFNYVRVYNPSQPVRGGDIAKYLYYFITDVRYIAPNTTAIVVQLDVWQTYIRQVQLGRCYIERGHLGIANTKAFQNYGRDYLTVPEGLDTGSEYVNVVMRSDDQIILPLAGKYSILVASTVKLEAAPGTTANPNLESAEGGTFQGLPSGASYYIFQTSADFRAFMTKYSKFPWVTQGIISISVIPPITRYFSLSELGPKLAIGAYKAPSTQATKEQRAIFPNWRENSTIMSYIPRRYRHLKKFWTFPYMAIELTTMTGQVVILKPEAWKSKDAIMAEEVALLPPNQRMIFYPVGYNYRSEAQLHGGEQGDGINYAAGISNFPALAIVNNGAIAVMASNAHSIAFGYQSADWSQQRALRGNETSYDQATAAMQAGTDLMNNDISGQTNALRIQQETQMQGVFANGITGIGSGVGMGAFGGPGGAVVGGVGGLISAVAGGVSAMITQGGQNRQLANTVSGMRGANDINQRTAAYMRDTNKGLADWAARGDYENAIAGLNAKTRDMQLTPPSVSGQVGGEALGILNFRMGYRVKWLMPDQASIQSVGEYWLRYGYAVQRFGFVPNDFMVMDKFTYWKMKETYIRAAGMPEAFKQAIRGIFEKGVTVWADPDDIGMIDNADNTPLPGITIDGYIPPDIDPEPEPEPPIVPKRKKKDMLVYSSVDDNPATPGPVWALAGTSPGTDANWIETRDNVRAVAFLEQCGVDDPVGLTIAEFAEYRDLYRSPVGTQEIPPAPEGV